MRFLYFIFTICLAGCQEVNNLSNEHLAYDTRNPEEETAASNNQNNNHSAFVEVNSQTHEHLEAKAELAKAPTFDELAAAWSTFQKKILNPTEEIDWFKLGIEYRSDWLYIADFFEHDEYTRSVLAETSFEGLTPTTYMGHNAYGFDVVATDALGNIAGHTYYFRYVNDLNSGYLEILGAGAFQE
ncbi:MAG: hypothetical protein JJT77_05115 [Crocinitomicaceae bacterium]|nr:hypothetical protein [Crocinitomicaceae bacterium]